MRSSLIAAFMVVPIYILALFGVNPFYAGIIVVGTTVCLALLAMEVLMLLTGKPSEVWEGVKVGLDEGLRPWRDLWRIIRGKNVEK